MNYFSQNTARIASRDWIVLEATTPRRCPTGLSVLENPFSISRSVFKTYATLASKRLHNMESVSPSLAAFGEPIDPNVNATTPTKIASFIPPMMSLPSDGLNTARARSGHLWRHMVTIGELGGDCG